MLIDCISQKTALIETDIARGRADKPRNGVAPIYSDMSKRTSSTPRLTASWRRLGFSSGRRKR